MQAAPVVLAVASTALSVVGTVYGMNAAQAQANYQAQVAAMNQSIANENAKRAIDRSQLEQQDQDAETLALLGQQQAMQGASGLDLGGKSFMLTRKAARELGRKDALNIRQAGEVEAYNYRTQAANFGAEIEMAKMEAKNAGVAGYLGVGQSLISGAAKVDRARRFGMGGLVS